MNIDTATKICKILDELISNKPNGISSFSELIFFVDDRPGHDRRYAIDSSKIKSSLDWSPEESFDTGLKKTVQWYLDNKYWWSVILDQSYKLERIGKK
jgi:dTDP-glucose 4,6-dehydratase